MVKLYYENYDPDYDHDDQLVELRESNLRRARNAHLAIGFGVGIMFTITAQYVYLWAIGLI